jgi:hypothetical protein
MMLDKYGDPLLQRHLQDAIQELDKAVQVSI